MARNLENAAGVGLTTLIILQIPQFYQNMLPLPVDIEERHPSSRYCASVRSTEWLTSLLAIAFGFAGSLITGTPWPFLGAALIIGIMVFQYEKAIRFYSDGE